MKIQAPVVVVAATLMSAAWHLMSLTYLSQHQKSNFILYNHFFKTITVLLYLEMEGLASCDLLNAAMHRSHDGVNPYNQ